MNRSHFHHISRLFVGLVFWVAGVVNAQPDPTYDPPASYYSGASGLSGPALKSALHQIIRKHTIIPYTSTTTDVWDALKVLDEDPANSANVILVYTGTSWPKSDTNGDGNPTTTTASWEREHCWPQSFGISDYGADTSDLFNLRACRRSVNSSRSNRYYAQANPTFPGDPAVAPPNCPECLYDYRSGQGGLWTPRPSEKGDLARAIFYMAVRYDGTDANTTDLEVGDVPNAAASLFGVLPTLLAWNSADPVSETERRRNHLIYTQFQRNRNPFIDHPEMVDSIFGSVPDLPALTLTISPSSANEGTSATGTVSITTATTNALAINLSKTGDPTNSEISIPASVIIPAGGTSATFSVATLIDGVADGDKYVSVLGDASGYQTGVASINVIDIDLAAGSSTLITGTGSYSQTFDTLPASGSATWSDDSTIPGWYAQRTGNGTTVVASTGSSTAGALYSFGTTADRALGSLGSIGASAGSFAWGVSFQNTTDQIVTLGTLSYAGEQWRNGGTGVAQTVTFSYQTGTASVTALTPASNTGWTALSSLDFSSPVNTTTAGLLDGNLAANRSVLSTSLDLILAPGQWITFRWRDIDHPGNDNGLSIDDFHLDWTVPTVPPPPVITSLLAANGRVGDAFTYQITASNGPTYFETESLPDGLSINGATGMISGTPVDTGTFDVTLVAGNTGGSGLATLSLTIEPAETPFDIWSGGLASTPALLRAYAVGGATGPNATGENPTVAYTGGELILTAIVRTDDPALHVIGEVSPGDTMFANSESVTEVGGDAAGVNQAGVPAGCERQAFRAADVGSVRKFMRLRIEREP